MKFRISMLLAVISLAATVAFAQTGFAGRWAADPRTAARLRSAGEASGFQLNLRVAAGNLTGTLSEGGVPGDPLTINDGRISGRTATFKTSRVLGQQTINVTWTATMTDEQTMTLNRAIEVSSVAAASNGANSNLNSGGRPATVNTGRGTGTTGNLNSGGRPATVNPGGGVGTTGSGGNLNSGGRAATVNPGNAALAIVVHRVK